MLLVLESTHRDSSSLLCQLKGPLC